MLDAANDVLRKHHKSADQLIRKYLALQQTFLLRNDLVDVVEEFCNTDEGADLRGTMVHELFRSAQEAVIREQIVCLAVRWSVARWSYFRLNLAEMQIEEQTPAQFLRAKEKVVEGANNGRPLLEIDLQPFERGFPRLREMRSIGNGVEYLNRYLSSRLFREIDNGGQQLYQFLRLHQAQGVQLMLNDRIGDLEELRDSLRAADSYLGGQPQEQLWTEIAAEMDARGFCPGWGRTVALARETMGFLSDILEAPAPESVARFLGRLPMIFSIAIISPHGYFGQSGVLGKPDTGGQVVYILDQVRALEKEMFRVADKQGIDIEPQILVVTRLIPQAEETTCDQRIEPIEGTQNARILRVPFREENGEITPHWISRFQVWPYLERFAIEAQQELLKEAGQNPDFIIGNYSDGNLVASLLAYSLKVTQCNIAHALEKTKYLYSDLYWKKHEGTHNFACQYTADLIAMNTADFVITSTYQEIAGTPDSIGQYESYQAYTLPDLYRVVYGIDVFDPKFNIVSPGADENVFFPAADQQRRKPQHQEEVKKILFEQQDYARGMFADPEKPILFAMSRLDYIKNPAGLVEWFGKSEALRQHANLLLIGGKLRVEESTDAEEQEQIRLIHELMDRHQLDGEMRWATMMADKEVIGEIYRAAADLRGAFVQPALFEAFGLTVIEAMASGLPTFATRYGGPLETIEDGISGFHIDPNHGEEAAEKMLDFFVKCKQEPAYWDRLAAGSLQRVTSHYSWNLYAERLLRLARIYGFWKYFSNIEREETHRYLEMLYFLAFRPMAEKVGK